MKLHNADDYAQALKRIDDLMFRGATPSSPEGKELDQLSKLVADYENRHDLPARKEKINLNDIYSRVRSDIYKK